MKRWLSRVLMGCGVLWILLVCTPVVDWWARWLSAGYSDEARPVLIVLAGERFNDNTIGYSTYLRCIYAVRYWREHHPQEILLSGEPAALMADFLAAQGVPRSQLRLEDHSTSTRENWQFLARMRQGDARPALLITSDFHMRRALRLAQPYSMDLVPHPAPDILKRSAAQPWDRPGLAWALAVETAKLLWER